MKYIVALIIAFSFSGCTFAQFSTGYSLAKIVYKDAKHVVYEIQEEKKRIKAEGLGEKQPEDVVVP